MFFKKWKNQNPYSPSESGEISFIIHEYDLNNSLFEFKKGLDCIPEWWSNLNTTFINDKNIKDLTLKSCLPFTDSLISGYFLVLKNDLYIKYDNDSKKLSISSEFLNLTENFSTHPIEQVNTMPISTEYVDDIIYKWSSKFLIKTPKGYSVLFTHPLNSPNLPFYTLSGIVETDTFFMPVLFPFLMKNNYNGKIKAGTPIVQIIPFKRDNWKSKLYTSVDKKFKIKENQAKNMYLLKRKEKRGRVIGGVYKKEHRVKKEFL